MNLRFASKFLHSPATRRLFSTLYVKNNENSILSYQNILSYPHLSKAVRQINFITAEDPEAEYQEDDPTELSEDFTGALESICKFPNLKGVGIHFSKQCSVEDRERWYIASANESPEFRSAVLKALLRGLNDPDHPTPNVRSLSLNNLQNVNDPSITSSAHFRSVLYRLTTLRLKIINEWEEASPESSWCLPDMYQFFAEFPATWLAPCASNLTALKLHVDVQWGFLPKADFQSIHFPRLKSLDLGNWTFSHDWQMEWILSHGATLEELTLDDCPIVHYRKHYGILGPDGYAVEPENNSGPMTMSFYERRWSSYFEEMERRLVKLKCFRYGIGSWGDVRHFEEDVLDERVGMKGYIALDKGLGPTPWIENRSSGGMVKSGLERYNFPMEEFGDDEDAYGKLMDTVEARK